MAFLEPLRLRFEVKLVLLQHLAQLAQVLHDQVRLRRAQLLQRVVARQHRAGMDAPVPRRLDVVLHVPDEQRLLRRQAVLLQDFVDLLALVPDVHDRACPG